MFENHKIYYISLFFCIVLGFMEFTAPASVSISIQTSADFVFTTSSGRIGATTAMGLSLIGVILGVFALRRTGGAQRLSAFASLSAGLLGVILGGLVAAVSGGRVGTGNGLGGAVVAIVVGVISVIVGATALFRFRRAG